MILKKNSNESKHIKGFTPTPESYGCKYIDGCVKNAKPIPESHEHKRMMWGFTLIEILIYTAVFAVVMGILSGFIVWVYRSNIKAQTMRETLNNARRAVEIMAYEIREARSIYTPTTTSTQLSLETLHYLPEGELSTYIDFFVCSNKLCLKKESNPPFAVTSDKMVVENLTFSSIATTSTIPSVQIALELKYKNPSGKSEFEASVTVTSTASMRAYY